MKQIAVWGSPGAGKSLVACAMANQLAVRGNNVIIINADKLTPMLPVFLPMADEVPGASLGKLLSGVINEENMRCTVQIHPKNKNMGFMSLTAGENGLKYQVGWQRETVWQVARFFSDRDFADYLVFDCTPDVLSDTVTVHALERADSVIQVISPDSRGMSFLQSQMSILRGGNFNQNHICVLNNAYEYSPVEQMQKDYNFPYVLSHSRSAYSKFIGGELIQGLDDAAGIKLEKTLKLICDKVAEQIE